MALIGDHAGLGDTRVRSLVLLVLLSVTMGAGLAGLVAMALVAAARALQGALA